MVTFGILAPKESKCSHSEDHQLTKRKGRCRGGFDVSAWLDVNSRLRKFEGYSLYLESSAIEKYGLSRSLLGNLVKTKILI